MRDLGETNDENLFQPIRELAEELNNNNILVISTPMWNLTVPYVLKQYIDIVVQPGNILQLLRIKRDIRTLFLMYSSSLLLCNFVVFEGINLHETKEWPTTVTPVTRNKTLIIVYSCGGNEGDGAFPKDYLGSYLKDVFALIGYDHVKIIRIQGSMKKKENFMINIQEEIDLVAQQINKKYAL